ncbi:MAG: indolepyruvate ferredoxin oxidoreductase subunit alpha [Sulfolobales archaeon]|nr:indolepyruvate ferredoxin oxidoreductase subunit alpha [Sulfolobales archaeon]MDW8010623.1 indolepyruvate ferredoxin oxidoreductase subunit alpha [Sulfolobales archaeon]
MSLRRTLGIFSGKALLLGNEAIARGALEAGVGVAAAYPGTPSSEIIGSLSEVASDVGVYVEWSTNEKVAFELSWAAALSGVRAITAMKHVGLNVAADALMSSAYTGVEEGFVIVSADDPSMWSSQNEQDNRLYGLISYIPVFEPDNPGEAKELTKALFDFSARVKHPVILRTTTRLSHTRGPVELGPIPKPKTSGFFNPSPAHVLAPSNARVRRLELLKKFELIHRELSSLSFNKIYGDGRALVVAAGLSHAYVSEAISKLGLEDRVRVLKLVSVYPVPEEILVKAVDGVDRVVVIEELEPLVETQVRAVLHKKGVGVEVVGRELSERAYEMSLDRAEAILRRALNISTAISRSVATEKPSISIPPRPPVFCSGCPYRPLFFELRRTINQQKIKAVFSGDIGCYTLAYYPPYKLQDTCVEMGGSIGLANGFSVVLRDVVVISVIGDSTFYHAGIPALVNSVYNQHPQVVIVLDNMVTAMTGHQPSPATRVDGRYVPIENVIRGIGVDFVSVVDPYDLASVRREFLRAVEYVRSEKKTAVLVFRRKCALVALDEMREAEEEIVPYIVDLAKCVGCGICYNFFACPAITSREDRRASVDPELCVGCGACVPVCPVRAIQPSKPMDLSKTLKYWF